MNDFITEARNILHENGLAPSEVLDASGTLVRCGTLDKPNSLNGAYILHADAPASLWFCNWRTGGSGTHSAKKGSALTPAEREALKSRITADKQARSEEQSRRHAEAADKAAYIWGQAQLAGDSHPYLQKKNVPSIGLKLACDGRLLLPVRGADGALQSLQFINDDGEKRFLTGGGKKGCYHHLPAKNGSKDGPLLIAEGYATAASLHMATGHAVLVAFDAGNLVKVARMARSKYPEREIILAADNDAATGGNTGLSNTGLTRATEAATAIDGKLVVPPLHEGRGKMDFNDLHQLRGLHAVAACVEGAAPVSEKASDEACPMPEGYFMKPTGKGAGLYHTKTDADGNTSETRLGPPLLVKGMTRDSSGNSWGLLLQWHDPDDSIHTWAMPLSILSQVGGTWHGTLVDGGWLGDFTRHKLLAGFLTAVRPKRRIRCVGRVGWFEHVFVLPDTTIGSAGDVAPCGEQVVLQSAHHGHMYRQKGSLSGWQELAALASGNSRLIFALCAALAGPLLRVAGMESGGFNFVGGSSTGKSTTLHMAASVWDAPGFVRSWRTTDNGAEGLAALHNDAVLILDELGQAAPKVCSEMSYMLSNGVGKTRSQRDGTTRNPQFWRLLFLSSGEVGLADKLTEAGQKPKPGQEVRLVDIPADASAGMGLFEHLHHMTDAGELALYIKQQAALHHGHAGRAFLAALLRDREEMERDTMAMVGQFVESVCPQGADGQVKRVAGRFALCAVAGVLAAKEGILPFAVEQVLWAVQSCFQSWLSARGGAGAGEDSAILADVRRFIEQHGASRFQDMDTDAAQDTDGAQRCINRVGFRRKAGESAEYLVLPESFKSEVVRGHNATRAARALKQGGMLTRHDSGRFTVKMRLPSLGSVNCYALTFPLSMEADQ